MEMSKMKKNMENANAKNITTSSEDNHVKDALINTLYHIKQKNWDKLMQNSDRLLEWPDLNSNIREVFENFKKSFEAKKTIFTTSSLVTAKHIMHKVQKSSDREL